jgi:AraC-like DNA-binding protein
MGGINEFQLGDQNSFPLLRQCYRKLQGLERSRPAGYEWRVHLLLTEVMGLLLEERGILAVPHVEQPLAVKRVIDVVLADPRRDWRVEELSERVAVSSSGLRALFRKVQHEGIHEFLQRVRLDCARVLLCDRTISVKEVAEKMNFSSEFYFSHFFRKGTGISPRQFRKDATS